MSNKAIETYLVEKIKEFLNTAEIFEREVLASQEKHMTNQIVVQDYKKKNPDGNFTEVKKNLIDIQDSYYKSFLLEQNLRHMLSTLKELYLMAQSTGVKIDLSENHKSVIDEIMKHSNNVFRAERNKDGEYNVVYVNEEIASMLEQPLNAKKEDEAYLESMFKDIPVV